MKTLLECAQDEEPPSTMKSQASLHQAGAEVEVLLINSQRAIRADWPGLPRFLEQLRARVARSSFSVRLVSDRTIRRFNKTFRGKDAPTDVLSFPAGEGDGYLGDIMISVETARESAARFGVTLQEELQILSLHGVLHLCGYDHEADKGQMARAESRWRRSLGLPSALIERTGAAGGSSLREGS